MSGRSGAPEGWLDYRPIGREIAATRIIACKTPLKKELYGRRSDDISKDRFTPQDCLEAVSHMTEGRKYVGLVLNLTNTAKYYNPDDFEWSRVHFAAIRCPGHVIPSDELFDTFCRSIYNFYHDYPRPDSVILVHCTHGVNRTGYMIARFLIQCEGWSPSDAIAAVGEARGYPIERENYLAHLHNLHKPSYLFPKTPKKQKEGEGGLRIPGPPHEGPPETATGEEGTSLGAGKDLVVAEPLDFIALDRHPPRELM